jgi:hypothetical protein
MFRFTRPAPLALLASTALVLVSGAALAQTTSSGAPGQTRARRNLTRQNRIARNISDAYSHKWEVAGGGGFLRFRQGESLQRISQVNFFFSPSYHLNPKWAIAGDVRGMYGNGNIPNAFALNAVYKPQLSEYTFLAGPQYRFIAREKFSLSGSALAGVGLSKFGGDAKGLPSQAIGLWPDSNSKAAFSVNVIADYDIYNNFALRVQPTFLGTTFGNSFQSNLGVEAGLVYRFGRQK